jgi:DNA polymerase (family 10)
VKRIIYKGKQFDLYVAEQQTYGPLILIRTGSAQHNIKLSQRALSRGMKLSHKGLIKDKNVIASTEKEIFTSLNLPYVKPEQRE